MLRAQLVREAKRVLAAHPVRVAGARRDAAVDRLRVVDRDERAMERRGDRVEQMAHALGLHLEVAGVHRVRRRVDGDALDNGDTVAAQRFDLRRVVGDEANARDAELVEHGRCRGVVARVDGQAEGDVRVDSVEALVLQRVRADLVREADTASLMTEVQDDAAAGARDGLERLLQLLATVAAERAEGVAGEALRVEADEHRLRPAQDAARDRNDLGASRPEDPYAEIARTGREGGLSRDVLRYGHTRLNGR